MRRWRLRRKVLGQELLSEELSLQGLREDSQGHAPVLVDTRYVEHSTSVEMPPGLSLEGVRTTRQHQPGQVDGPGSDLVLNQSTYVGRSRPAVRLALAI